MHIKISKDTKKYILLIEELKELIYEGYLCEKYYPDMAEITEYIYDCIVQIVNNPSCNELIVPQFYDLDQLNELIKQGRKNKRKDSQ